MAKHKTFQQFISENPQFHLADCELMTSVREKMKDAFVAYIGETLDPLFQMRDEIADLKRKIEEMSGALERAKRYSIY